VLPDLLPMAGVKVDRVDVPETVAAGWRSHHRADAAFHAHPVFIDGVNALRTDLRRTALGTGPRRAAAHVGWELLLDDALVEDEATVDAFRAALRHGGGVSQARGWTILLDRLGAIRPGPPADVSVIAQRVQRAVGRRPRLAFGDEHVEDVAAVLAGHRPRILAAAPALLAELAR
ncbi:MAG: hypothetical protein QOJ67_3238, partial [Acidimicrobiaceae bacterium]